MKLAASVGNVCGASGVPAIAERNAEENESRLRVAPGGVTQDLVYRAVARVHRQPPPAFVPVRITPPRAARRVHLPKRRRRRDPGAHRARDVCHRVRMREPASMIRPAHQGIDVWLYVVSVDFTQ